MSRLVSVRVCWDGRYECRYLEVADAHAWVAAERARGGVICFEIDDGRIENGTADLPEMRGPAVRFPVEVLGLFVGLFTTAAVVAAAFT